MPGFSPMLLTMNDPLHLAAQCLKEFSKVKIALVYGSFASGKFSAQSDLDLGIAAHTPLDMEDMVKVQTKLSLCTGREVDLIDLNTATGTVLKEALTTGHVLFDQDPVLFARILSRMVTEEADFGRLRNQLLEARRRKTLG